MSDSAPSAGPFAGFPEAALDFYDDLELDNTKSFWAEHRHVWESAVRDPMRALAAALAEEFGEARIYRPYRDVRFAKDKTPYKTHQGAFVSVAPRTGWYVQIGAAGVRTSAGFYDADAEQLHRFRSAVDDDIRGPELARLVAHLEGTGWKRVGDRLKTTPRGYAADHPRIDLLRHRSLSVDRHHGFAPYIHTAELADKVRADWREARELVEWLGRL
ncbi:DUF2461 domain-containing protein [Nocardioides massiliensis]|uniref:Uncharacterized protein (TIGR02453 family) n=1 Tax=Nocardioides massiliensis TaxID=1325935 RepID=A0ABT9NM38_9ACTN|nr:DUF2461 domain-containing protein [Nocardioides massiliensis]MDP9821486.1 uncharacterized protein (TIGR02453 family) [Nocardioides massiliensis]